MGRGVINQESGIEGVWGDPEIGRTCQALSSGLASSQGFWVWDLGFRFQGLGPSALGRFGVF